MRLGNNLPGSWAEIVDAIVRGDRPRQSFVRLGPTSKLLQQLGLSPVDLVMSVDKLARTRREHEDVSLAIWHRLPQLIERPLVVLPSARRDGSIVVVLVVTDSAGDPVLVPIAPGLNSGPNTLLSVYGKQAGYKWVRREIERASKDGLPHFVGKGFAATLPQPGSAKAIPSSPGPIPLDGTAKPERHILRLGEKINEPDDKA